MGVHAMQGEMCGYACNAVGLLQVCVQWSWVAAAGVHAMQGELCMQCRVIGEGVRAMQGELCGCACNAVGLQRVCMQCRVRCACNAG